MSGSRSVATCFVVVTYNTVSFISLIFFLVYINCSQKPLIEIGLPLNVLRYIRLADCMFIHKLDGCCLVSSKASQSCGLATLRSGDAKVWRR